MTTEERDFLESLAIGAACKALPVRKKLPIAYSYNGVVLPELPERDREKYPYLATSPYITSVYAYAFSAPLTAELETNLSGNPVYVAKAEEPFLRCDLVFDFYARDKWSEWETVTDSEEFQYRPDSIWTNHDVIASDGTIQFAGAEPAPVYLPCVLYDGEVTTEEHEYQGTSCGIQLLLDFGYGDILGITIDGISGEYTAKSEVLNGLPMIGNVWLYDNDMPDDGGNWLLICSAESPRYRTARFYTRTPGTHHVKIELLEVAKE